MKRQCTLAYIFYEGWVDSVVKASSAELSAHKMKWLNQHKWQGASGSMCLQHAESAFDGYNRREAVLVQCVCVCVCVFIKLHITAQSGLVILVILCHSH